MDMYKSPVKRRLLAFSLFSSLTLPAHSLPVFVNEFHYDNTGSDVDEMVELAGEAGTDLSGWQLLLYNGLNGNVYDAWSLGGVITDQQNGFGTLAFGGGSIQNGGPDGMALVDDAGTVLQFISYEGSFVAQDGAATGLTSLDIAIEESSSTAPGFSLQLAGIGSDWEQFGWELGVSSFGGINLRQTFPHVESNEETDDKVLPPVINVPEPSSGLLLLGGLLILAGRAAHQRL